MEIDFTIETVDLRFIADLKCQLYSPMLNFRNCFKNDIKFTSGNGMTSQITLIAEIFLGISHPVK
jgi:hypothetical protein